MGGMLFGHGSRLRTLVAMASGVLCAAALGCSGGDEDAGRMKLLGGGATFPYPLYEAWFEEYSKSAARPKVEYESVGSGKGIDRFLKGEGDFAASDAPLTDAQIAAAPQGALLLPTTAAPIGIAYKTPGVPDGLRMPRDVYVDIFLGKIRKWNDPRLVSANPGVPLPDLEMKVVVRADSSGTTHAFTQHLSAVSPEWKSGPGVGTKIAFPGNVLTGDGNTGVARTIQTTPGAIGYVVLRDARGAGLSTARLQNKAGKYVMPSVRSGEAALVGAAPDAHLRVELPDPEGEAAYPIVAFTWLLLPRKPADAAKGAAVRDLARWCLTDGQDLSEGRDFIPLSKPVAEAALKALEAADAK